jgi:hypothetical protein
MARKKNKVAVAYAGLWGLAAVMDVAFRRDYLCRYGCGVFGVEGYMPLGVWDSCCGYFVWHRLLGDVQTGDEVVYSHGSGEVVALEKKRPYSWYGLAGYCGIEDGVWDWWRGGSGVLDAADGGDFVVDVSGDVLGVRRNRAFVFRRIVWMCDMVIKADLFEKGIVGVYDKRMVSETLGLKLVGDKKAKDEVKGGDVGAITGMVIENVFDSTAAGDGVKV